MDSESEGLRGEPAKLSIQLLKEITDDFAEYRLLGYGASADVYEGVLKDGREVAIKMFRFIQSSDYDKSFRNELRHLKGLKNQNVVQLVGFCDEITSTLQMFEGKMVLAEEIHMALCLEFMAHGGLSKYISGKEYNLNWHTRFQIIQGTCRGLKYLHELFTMHCDLKPDNILLDEKMMPRIADLGISRLLREGCTELIDTPLGTRGFLPPEYIERKLFSEKFDIFSLGVTIKWILTGMDYWNNISGMDDHECIEHVHRTWRKRLQKIPDYKSLEADCKQARTCIEIAVECTQGDPCKRPRINDIVCRLSNVENKENDSQFDDGYPETPPSPGEGNDYETGSPVASASSSLPLGEWNFFRPEELPLQFLCEITNDFSVERIVSEPAFATVYKGILQSGEEILVKRFGGCYLAAPGINVFRSEFDKLMHVQHENVLRLIGFSHGKMMKVVTYNGRYILTHEVEAEAYLCHEYANSGSLDKYIYDGPCQLDWNARFRIIKGICEGLHFLHTGLDVPIVGTPLAPQDILLDSSYMVPKLSDVGVSDLFDKLSRDRLKYSLREMAYMAPENLERIKFSLRSDIYRLGLLIMQIATGKENEPSIGNHFGVELISMVRNLKDGYMESKYKSLDTDSIDQFELCIQTGLRCTKLRESERPSIQEIVQTLNIGSMLNEDITSSSTAARTQQLISSLQHELSSYQKPASFPLHPRWTWQSSQSAEKEEEEEPAAPVASMASISIPDLVPSPTKDAENIRKAVQEIQAMADEVQALTKAFSGLGGLGVDESTMVTALSNWRKQPEKRSGFRKSFPGLFKEHGVIEKCEDDYILHLTAEFSRFKNLMVLWAMHPWERDARLAHHVLHQEHPAAIVVEIACTRSAEELLGARKAYMALFHHSLEEDVAYRAKDKAYCSLLVGLVSAYRYEGPKVNSDTAKAEAKALGTAVKSAGSGGTKLVEDEEVVRILTTKSKPHLVETFKLYKELHGKHITEDLGSEETLGETVQCLATPEVYFSQVMAAALKDGADHHGKEALSRVAVTRSDVDMDGIRAAYQEQFGAKLEDAVAGSAHGQFKDALVALIVGK